MLSGGQKSSEGCPGGAPVVPVLPPGGADGKHPNDHYDDNQRSTGDPPADRRLLLFQLLIVRVGGGVALTVRRLAVSGLATLPMELAALAVCGLSSLAIGDVRTLAALGRRTRADQSLWRGR